MDYSLPLAFTVGLFSSLHCVGMCGGIIGALSFGVPATVRQSSSGYLLYLLTYSLGRILSYAVAGAMIGLVGEGLLELMGAAGGRRWLQWAVAIVMVAIGLHVAGWLPRLVSIERLGGPLWRYLEPIGRRLMPIRSIPQAFAYGAVWGWLPCGLVYTMLISAIAKVDALQGALYMAFFGLGTLPAILATGFLAGRLLQLASKPMLRVGVGLSIVVMGLLTLWYPEVITFNAYEGQVSE